MINSQKVTENGYEVVFTGLITSKEMFDIGESFKSDPNFVNFDYILMWFTKIENMLIDTNEIRQLAHLDKKASKRNPDIRFAVATDSDLVFGLARMWEAFYGKGPWKPMVFGELEEARKFAYYGNE